MNSLAGQEPLREPVPLERVPAPCHVGGDYLYLDYDGVLHHEDVRLTKKKGTHFGEDAFADVGLPRFFEHAWILAEVLADLPDVRIVLSTTWVRQAGCWHGDRRLPSSIRQRVVGATYHSCMDWRLFRMSPRGMQVWADVQRRRPRAWMALDDDAFGWPAWCRDKLIKTPGRYGISCPNVVSAMQSMFGKEFSSSKDLKTIVNRQE